MDLLRRLAWVSHYAKLKAKGFHNRSDAASAVLPPPSSLRDIILGTAGGMGVSVFGATSGSEEEDSDEEETERKEEESESGGSAPPLTADRPAASTERRSSSRPARAGRWVLSDVKSEAEKAPADEGKEDLEGEPLDEDLDGEPLEEVGEEDLDGEPLDEEEDLDGEPLDEEDDLDGEPLEVGEGDVEMGTGRPTPM